MTDRSVRHREAPDRNLAMELVRVTEAAAMAAGRWVGRGDKNGGDGAAVDAMRQLIGTVSMRGVVVIGEGEVTLEELVPVLLNAAAQDASLAGVNGVVFRDRTGQIVRTPVRALLPDLSDRPHPDRARPRRRRRAAHQFLRAKPAYRVRGLGRPDVRGALGRVGFLSGPARARLVLTG